MYLKEIAISGFKSFADRTRLDLQRGMTAVVGPNGCGKSNIVDAIRWVLGEQSAKALRGASMQDVIFEGTDKRKPLPVCEVALTFTDCESELGTAFNEVEISRRVSREGGSDYYINGKAGRLKDIQRLFANTGVGRVSYSFMLQGQIDQILSTNPSERRTIFEEAAGITLYKAQRKEALNKLALVDQNLSRVTDVIEEVSRQIGSLKRQASKALRYQRIRYRLTHLDLAYCAHRYASLEASTEALAKEAEALRASVGKQNESLQADEASLAEKKAARGELSNSMQERQQRVYNLRSEKENAENQSEFATIRATDLGKRIAAYKDEISELESQQEALAERAKSESENKQLQLGVVDDSDKIFRDRNAELVAAQEALGRHEGQQQEQRQAILHAENRINRARSRCTTLEVDLKTYQVKHAQAKETSATLARERETLEKDQADIDRQLHKRKGEREAAEAAVEAARKASQQILSEFRSLQETIQEKDRGIARQTAQLNVLETLQAKFEGFGEGAKAILENKVGETVASDDVTIISKVIKVEPTYTRALETLLGRATDALFVSERPRAQRILEALDTQQLGRACLQFPLASQPEADAAECPEGVLPAASVVEVRDPAMEAPVRALLQGCYFANDLSSFLDAWEARPDFEFLWVATESGELVDRRGLLHGGRSSGQQPASLLERESEIRRLGRAIKTERAALSELREQATALDEKRNAAEATVEAERKRAGALASEVSGLEAEARGQAQKLEQNARSRDEAETALERLEATHGDSVKALEAAREELEAAESGLESERAKGDELEAAIERAREHRDAKREALSDVRLELAEKKQRLESADRALNEVQRETASLQERVLRRQQEIDTFNEQIEQFRKQAAAEKSKAEEVAKTLKVAGDQLEKDRGELKAMDEAIEALDSGLSGQRKEAREAEQALSKLEVKLAEERSQLGFVRDTAEADYQVELSKIDWKQELWQADAELQKRVNLDDLDDPDQIAAQPKHEQGEPTEEDLAAMEATDWAEVEREVSELKGRIANMGPVNLDAIGEYADLKERHDFLRGQSEDLWNSKNELVKTIDEINETSQTLFRDTFEQVRRNFAFTYEKLSGGGASDLQLVDADDPLESGIEIIARPPGTRLKSVTLLSGGQRTMAAVALLFAIYLVKPSPFCVLDEIDAALDDANIGRFCDTLKGFTDKSQFLIITHNKRTIANADTVFGVTMPEKGVSKMVSMRFNSEAERAQETAG